MCNTDVHSTSRAKHITIKKQLDIEKVIRCNFFNEPNDSNKTVQKFYNPKTWWKKTREKIKIDDERLVKEIVKEID